MWGVSFAMAGDSFGSFLVQPVIVAVIVAAVVAAATRNAAQAIHAGAPPIRFAIGTPLILVECSCRETVSQRPLSGNSGEM
jgi:hypothetical protein